MVPSAEGVNRVGVKHSNGGVNIKVCDAIMGSGKTSAAIQYMNANPDRHYVYVAPVLEEDQRIADSCPELNFVLPDIEVIGTKLADLKRLLREHRNIAITHALFEWCDDEVCELLELGQYVMIIDEAIDIFHKSQLLASDIEALLQAGELLEDEEGWITTNPEQAPKEHTTPIQNDLKYARSRSLVRVDKTSFCYWVVSPRMLMACNEIIIMTYLFRFSSMYQLLQLHQIPFRYIYIRREGERQYCFTDHLEYLPEYMGHMHDYIRVVDMPKLNRVGDQRNALSVNWLKRECDAYNRLQRAKHKMDVRAFKEKLKQNKFYQLRSSLHSFMRYELRDVPAGDKLWTCFKRHKDQLKDHGYADNFLYCTCSSVNTYGDRHYLAYLANIIAIPEWLIFYKQHGLEYEPDGYSLTTMLQWIWRSAIRNGEQITLYLPSSRMRGILERWMNQCEKEYAEFYGTDHSKTLK